MCVSWSHSCLCPWHHHLNLSPPPKTQPQIYFGKSCPLKDPTITAHKTMVAATWMIKNFNTTLNPHSLLLPVQHETFPRQRLCSSLVFCSLGYCDSPCGHTPSSPNNSSRTHLPGPSHVIPLTQSLHRLLVLNTKSSSWQTRLQRDPLMHTTRPLSRSTPACSPSQPPLTIWLANSFPVWLWFQRFPYLSHLLQFLLKYPIYVYFITTDCNSGLLEGFCKFYCCTPITLLRMRAPVKLMKCKCQSFCLPLFFIFSAVVWMSMLWRRWKYICISNFLLHELTQPSCW